MLPAGARIRFARDITDVIDEENPFEYATLAREGEEGVILGDSEGYYLVKADVTGAEFEVSWTEVEPPR